MDASQGAQAPDGTGSEPRPSSFEQLWRETMQVLGLWKDEVARMISGLQARPNLGASATTSSPDEGRVTRVSRHLYRSRSDRIVRGVCAGLADYFGLPVALVRLAFVILFFTGVFHAVIPYVVLALLIPESPWERV